MLKPLRSGWAFDTRVKALPYFLVFFLYYILVKAGMSVMLAKSIFFVCLSSYILVIAFSFRSLRNPLFSYNPFSNMKLNFSILVGGGLLFFTVASPFMRSIFNLVPIPLIWVPLIVSWLAINVLLVEGAKYLMSSRKFFFGASNK